MVNWVGLVGSVRALTWGDTSKECYETTLAILQRAADWLAENNKAEAFGGPRHSQSLDEKQRRQVAARLMPLLRGKITGDQSKVGHFNDTAEILQFVNASQLEELAALGTSCTQCEYRDDRRTPDPVPETGRFSLQ